MRKGAMLLVSLWAFYGLHHPFHLIRQRFSPTSPLRDPEKPPPVVEGEPPTPLTACCKSLLWEKHVDFGMTQTTIEYLFSGRP